MRMLESDLLKKPSSLSSRDCFLDDGRSSAITIATTRIRDPTLPADVTRCSDANRSPAHLSEQSVGTVAEVERMFTVPQDEKYTSRTMYR